MKISSRTVQMGVRASDEKRRKVLAEPCWQHQRLTQAFLLILAQVPKAKGTIRPSLVRSVHFTTRWTISSVTCAGKRWMQLEEHVVVLLVSHI